MALFLASNALFFLGGWRKPRDDLDHDILRIGDDDSSRWQSFVARPWYVVDAPPMLSNIVENCYILIPELGAAMVDAALHGSEQGIMDNAFMRQKGQNALKLQPNESA